jgi:GNAT superfamily N-acetyltransferase
LIIREYNNNDSLGWIRCRVLSFLDSAFYDNVLREKECYKNPSIELVAEADDKIVGLIDIEYELEKGTVCYDTKELGGVIWSLAVLPEYRNQGISTLLLNKAIDKLRNNNINKLEAWTRDDKWVNEWYINRGFSWKERYLHVYAEGKECNGITQSKVNNMLMCNCFAHYVGENEEDIKKTFKRVHECNLYELAIS